MRTLTNFKFRRRYSRIIAEKFGRKKYKFGSECYFVPINRQIGAKLYNSVEDRDYALIAQKRAYGFGLAPKPGTKFKIVVKFETYYGYTTQIAKIVNSDYLNEDELEDCLQQSYELGRQLFECGISIDDDADLHYNNIGFIKDKMVAIDFGPLSLTPRNY